MSLSTPRSFVARGHIDEVDFIDLASNGWSHLPRRVPKGSILTVAGWAATPDDPGAVAGVYVRIDRGALLEARYGLDRPDVADALQSAAFARCGFYALCSTSQLQQGEHTVTLLVRDSDGRTLEIDGNQTFSIDVAHEALAREEPFEVDSPSIHIDEVILDGEPAPGVEPLHATAADVLHVRGWAVDHKAGRVGQSIFAVIGTTAVRGQYGIPREDVASETGVEGYRNSGFAVAFPFKDISAGEHVLTIRLVGADGVTVYAGTQVRIDVKPCSAGRANPPTPSGPGRASIDEVLVVGSASITPVGSHHLHLVVGEHLFIRGWALDRTNERPAAGLLACIDDDDSPPAAAVCGLERSDVAAAFGNPQLAPCGFTLVLPARTAGTFEVEFRVVDHDGVHTSGSLQPITFSVTEPY